MKIRLAYGRSGLDAEIPDGNLLGVLRMRGSPPVADPGPLLEALLAAPMGGHPLETLAGKARSACIAVCDITRPVPNAILLPPVLDTLRRGGLPDSSVVFLIATGLHRPSTSGERMSILGEDICGRYRVVDHRARVREEQRPLGATERGTPVAIDVEYCHADLKITVGFIEPHLMAGFSGGRKVVAPGCAGEDTIKALHSPDFLEHPLCREGSLDGNPLHDELLEIARMAGHDFCVNVALDGERRLTGMFAGDPLEAHARGVAHVRAATSATIPHPADIVVTTSAGYPLDLTLYQAVKGMTAALPVVKPGGVIILAAECAEGLGSQEFGRLALSFRSPEVLLQHLRTRPVEIDQWQMEEWARAARQAEVILVSGAIAQRYRESLCIGCAESFGEALEAAFSRQGRQATVAVIPQGPYTLAEVAGVGDPPRQS